MSGSKTTAKAHTGAVGEGEKRQRRPKRVPPLAKRIFDGDPEELERCIADNPGTTGKSEATYKAACSMAGAGFSREEAWPHFAAAQGYVREVLIKRGNGNMGKAKPGCTDR
jgi:hypothetical protein